MTLRIDFTKRRTKKWHMRLNKALKRYRISLKPATKSSLFISLLLLVVAIIVNICDKYARKDINGHDICSQAINIIDEPMDFIIIKWLIGQMAEKRCAKTLSLLKANKYVSRYN